MTTTSDTPAANPHSGNPVRQYIRGAVVIDISRYADHEGHIGDLPADAFHAAWVAPGTGLATVIDLGAARDISPAALSTIRWLTGDTNTIEVHGENAQLVNQVVVAIAFPDGAA